MGIKPRIFHGVYNIAGIPGIISKQEREAGFNSKSACFPQGVYQRDVDEIITQFSENLASKYINEFDVFNFHFGSSLVGQSLDDLSLLKKLGKKIIMHFHGCDIRDSKIVMRKYAVSACHVCVPMACNANRDIAHKKSIKHANAIVVYTPDLVEFIEGAHWVPQPVNIEALRQAVSETKIIKQASKMLKIVHAPSSVDLKGSKYLQAACAELINEGYKIELTLLNGKSHDEVLQAIKSCDIAVDQLLIGAHGVFAIEAMALGTPTICYIRDDILSKYGDDFPIINASIFNIKDVIKDIYANRDKLPEIGEKSAKYVDRAHSISNVSQKLISIYNL